MADDEAPGLRDDRTDPAFRQTAQFLVGRARYDLYAESYVGTLFTDREFLDGYSRVGGFDTQLRINRASRFNFVAYQSTHRDEVGVERSGPMWGALYSRNGRNLRVRSFVGQTDPDFRTDVGFVRRVDQQRTFHNVDYRWFPEHWLIDWGPTLQYERSYNFDDVLEDEVYEAGLRFSFARSISADVTGQRVLERFDGVGFWKWRRRFSTSINSSRGFSLGLRADAGDEIFFDPDDPFLGRQTSVGVNATVRPWSSVQSRVSLDTARFTDVRTGESEVFDVKIWRGLTTWQLTDRFLLRNISEYNTFSTELDLNFLLTYRVNAGTAFYLGYDDHYRQADQRIRRHQRRDRIEGPAPQGLRLRRQATALIVGQLQSPAPELLLEDAVLLDQVGNDVLLMPIDPAGDGQEQQLEREGGGRHRPIVGALNSMPCRRLPAGPVFGHDAVHPAREREDEEL